jgi:hypothetical protein
MDGGELRKKALTALGRKGRAFAGAGTNKSLEMRNYCIPSYIYQQGNTKTNK